MPYELRQKNNKYCVVNHATGETIDGGCHDSKADAERHMSAVYANETKALPNDVLTALGGTVKSINADTFELCMYKFTNADRPDLTGEYFDDNTDFVETDYPFTCKLLYHHGLSEDIEIHPIGEIVSAERRPGDGIYGRGVINFASRYKQYVKTLNQPDVWKAEQYALADDYENLLKELMQRGKLAGSGGALPQSFIVDDDGRIKRWAAIEYSLTPAPAEPQYTKITSVKSLPSISLRGLLDSAGKAGDVGTNSQDKQSNLSGVKTMDEAQLRKLIQEELAAYFDAVKQTEDVEIPDDAMAAVADEAVEEMTEDKEEMKSLTREKVEAKVAEIAQALIAKSVQSAFEKRARIAANVAAAASNGKKAAEANGRAPVNGMHSENTSKGFQSTSGGSNPRISVGESLKYAHLSADDMMLGHEIIASQFNDAQRSRMKSSEFLSEEYLRTMVGKTLESVDKKPSRNPMDQLFIKSVLKANEVDSTTNTGFGPEWVGQVWSTRIWEKARVLRVYEQMIAKGMMEVEIPQGASTTNISTESTDPTVYSYPQINDLDSTGRPSVELAITPFGTGTVALTPGTLGMASAYSVLLEEDSVIPILPQLTYQQDQKAQETIEQVIVNGDTATGANTNINLIDGTPGTGTSRPYYLASNGILKYPLVTATALSRDANGSLSLDDFRKTIALFAPQFQTRLDNLFWMVDPYVNVTALGLPELATDDVRRTNATITSGLIRDLFGITFFNEGFMLKANSAGKIPAAGGTLGRFALVYAPYWAFGFKRQIKVETGYDVLAQTKILVTTMRFGIVNRGRDAAAVTYNVGLS